MATITLSTRDCGGQVTIEACAERTLGRVWTHLLRYAELAITRKTPGLVCMDARARRGIYPTIFSLYSLIRDALHERTVEENYVASYLSCHPTSSMFIPTNKFTCVG